MNLMRTNQQKFDRGWSWMVLVGACLMVAIVDGLRNSSGIFFSQLIDTMQLSKTQAATVIAVLNAMFMLPGPVASAMALRLGTRSVVMLGSSISAIGLLCSAVAYSFWPLIVAFGIVGLGFSLSFVPALGALNLWFFKHRQMAPAACMASGALGIFAIAPLTQFLIDAYSWRGAVVVLAGLVLQISISGTTYFPRKLNSTSSGFGDRGVTSALFKNPSYCLHLLQSYLMFGIQFYIMFIVRHVTNHRNFTPHQASALVSVCGIASFFGRLLVVVVNLNKKTATRHVRLVLFNLTSFFGALGMAAIPWLWNFYAVAGVSLVMGFIQGIKLALVLGITLDIVTPKFYQMGYGYFHFLGGISVLTVSPFAGFLAETFGNFDPCFYLSTGANFCSLISGLAVHFLELRKSKGKKRAGSLQVTATDYK